ncbi:DUF2235 domain-containing protein [Tardiphaga sp.]|uniref:DUF2235 domain-containing protein n=1 Tax=Tardiphaga sp. TaxID=1926292 RepID=UPI00261E45F2|nr:DUF2235 domain-containing protein [Tardiphaga sp.]MDB5615924.1 hypothetical protein [Tardiphaga sp.]
MSDKTKPGKRLALFLDGTWNTVSDNTNVWRLRSLFLPVGPDGIEQRAYYSTGLGTKFGEKVRGGMFGSGIDTAITSAYEWLIENFEFGDEIFILGFSRGAYTARSLSGFISKCGLAKRGAPLGVNQLYKRYRNKEARTIRALFDVKPQDLSFEDAWLLKHSRAVPIKFIGVFDTVGALGVPFPLVRRIFGSAYPFLNTGLRQNNEHAFHALAVDEHREPFAPTLWTNQGATNAAPRPIEKTEQRWFVGAHANVGGGCFSDLLAQLPLSWIESKAQILGLGLSSGYAAEDSAITGKISDSYAEFMKGCYRLVKLGARYYRPIGVPPPEEGPNVKNINETIDRSVFDRWRADKSYRPPGLAQWAKRHSVDPAAIGESVFADAPATTAPS